MRLCCSASNTYIIRKMSRVAKSYHNDDPIVQYTTERSIRMTDVQKRLKEETLKHPRGRMMGAPEVVQLNTNIMQAICAKKGVGCGCVYRSELPGCSTCYSIRWEGVCT